MIIDGWPEDASDVLKDLRKYFSHVSMLTVEDGLILWGKAVLIPEFGTATSPTTAYDGYKGITKTNLWTKNVIYWPGDDKRQ